MLQTTSATPDNAGDEEYPGYMVTMAIISMKYNISLKLCSHNENL